MNSTKNSRNSSSGANQIFFWALTADYNSLKRALEGGMSVNVIDPVTTDSPLMIACRKGHTNIVRLCLEYGAKNDPHPEFGQTALHASISEQKIESARVLLEIAAESDADHIISNLSDPSGQTPLHTAAYIGSTAMIELLLHHGASISSVDAQGQTALHLCASSGVKICLAMLLDHGGDDMIDLQDNGGNTALHHATFHGRLECVRLLLETAADVSIRNYEGYTAYNIASSEGHQQIGLLLHEYRDLSNISGPSSATNSNQPTPSKTHPNSSQLGTPLHYQTPQSSSKYGRQASAEYAYSPSAHYDLVDDATDSPERQIRLNILPQSTANTTGAAIPTRRNQSSSLTLNVPTNPLSAIYGSNGGMGNIDSMGTFLPRPHTVSSPNMKRPHSVNSNSSSNNGGGLHAAALRGQSNSARGPCTNPMYQSHDVSALTHNGVAAHNYRNHASSAPSSPNSAPSSTTGEGDTYKVLAKQQHHSSGFIPPTLSRQSSESVASRLSYQSDPGAKMQLFDTVASTGIPTYTKSNIIPEQSRRRNSADSAAQMYTNPPAHSSAYQDTMHRGYEPVGDGMHTSHSSSAIERLQHSHTNSAYGHEYHSTDHLDQINAHSNAHTEYPGSSSYTYGNSKERQLSSLATSTATAAESYEGYGGDYSTEVAAESCDYAAPVEEFTCLDRSWTVYYTEDQHLYYLDMANDHSQWEDPREFGLRLFSAVTESPTGRTSEPPKSPSPKALERTAHGRSFQFNNIQHNNHEGGDQSGDENESPRVRDIKPIKLNWDGRKEEEIVTGGKRENNHSRTATAAVKRLQIEEFSSDSSEDDLNSAVKVRFHRTTAASTVGVVPHVGEGSSKEERNKNAIIELKEVVEEEVLDLDHIALSGEKIRPGVVGSLFPESTNQQQEQHCPPPYQQRSHSGEPFETVEKLEKGRIRLLTSQYERVGSKPLSPVNSPLHSSSFYSSNNHSNSNISKTLQDIEKTENNEPTDMKTPEKNTRKVFQPTVKDVGNKAETTEISREEAEVYIQAVVQGKSLQEVGEWLDRDGRSQAFRLQTLSWADEAVILNPTATNSNSSNNTANTSTGTELDTSNTTVPKETVASLKEDAVLGKYAKMLSMGVPAGNVLMKLKMENIELTQRNRLMRAAGQDLEPEPTSSTTTTTMKIETIDELKADAVLGKYAKMLSMGVPPGNVLMKLKLENIEVKQRNRLMRAAGQELEKEEGGAESTTATTSTVGGVSMIRRPSANMQNLHWNTLPEERVKNSIWAKASNSTNEIDIAETDLEELERLFGAHKEKNINNFTTTRNISQTASTKISLQLQYLDKKRAQNIVIGLNPFKSLGNYVDILKAMCSLDTLNGKITSDMIDNFMNLLPTEAELKRIDKINGSKHPAELFFQAVMLFYPELPNRLQCFNLCLNFPIKYDNIIEKTKNLINACNQVLSSANLTKLLQRMLKVGNILNEGTKRGGAGGFTLDSLTKVVNTKGVDKKTSVLDYVIKSLYDKQEEGILTVLTDLNLIEASARLSGTELLKEYDNLQISIENLEKSYINNSEKYNEPNFNSPTAKKIINQYQLKLNEYLLLYQKNLIECNKNKIILIKKINDIIQYFGEDPKTCSTEKIFGSLHEFLRAIAFSKTAIEWKLYRSNSSNNTLSNN